MRTTDMRKVIKLLEKAKMEMGSLEREGVSLEVFVDILLGNVAEVKSQIWYVIGLVDE